MLSRTIRLELWGASRKSALLEEVAGVPVEIVAPDGRVVGSERLLGEDGATTSRGSAPILRRIGSVGDRRGRLGDARS